MLKDYLSKLFPLAVFLLAVNFSFGQYATVTVDPPAGSAGDYYGKIPTWGPAITSLSGEIVLVDDGVATGTVNDGCDVPFVNDVNGKIALMDRGTCAFTIKAENAQAAGASGIIICNNAVANPYQVIFMGGTPTVPITVPVLMLSYSDCQAIKADLGSTVNATINAGVPAPQAGEDCSTAISIGPGTHTVPDMTSGLGGNVNAGHGYWYEYTPSSDVLATVSSCGGGVNTRVFIVTDGCAVQTTTTSGNDNCDTGLGAITAAEATWIATAGVSYLIQWDDFSDYHGFDWTLTENSLPVSDVTFNVDMKNETVAGDGVKLIVNGGAEIDMVDNGDGTWSYTGSYTATEVLDFRYANGSGNVEDNPDLSNCRTIEVGLTPVLTTFYCYNSCAICPPDVACPNWINDDFEGYTLGGLSNQSNDWGPWTPGSTTEDAEVSNAFAFGGSQSMHISAANADDQLLLLGNRTAGHFILKWKMYVPTGSGGYYNLQKNQDTPGVGDAFANEVVFNIDGTGVYNIGNTDVAFSYPHDEWFEVYHDFDLDNNLTRVWIDGEAVSEHPSNWQAGSQTGITQVGGVDFFGFADVSTDYYVDNVLFKQIEACPAKALVCDAFDGYDLGETGPQSPWWTTWDLMDGSVTDGLVTNNQFLSCEQAMEISETGGDDVILDFGLRTEGNYSLSWDMYVPTGFGAYYNIQKNVAALPNPAQTDFAIQVNMAVDGTVTMDAGAAAAFTFTFPHDQWFNVSHDIDLDNNWATLSVNGVEVAAWPANWAIFATTGAKQINGVDFYGNTDNLYYVDNVMLVQLPSVPGNICGSAIDLNDYIGQGQGTTVTTPLFDNTFYTTTQFDPQAPADGYECFGEPDGAGSAPELNNTIWFSFTGDGQTYNIESGACNATNVIEDGDTQMAIFSGDCNGLTPVACNEDIIPQPVPNQFWSGLELETEPGTDYYMMIDGFNFGNGTQLSAGEFCINFTQLTGAQILPVTFIVNMSNEVVTDPEAIFIAGSFNGWSDQQMTAIGANRYRIILNLEVGQTYEYKFKNGSGGWENANAVLINCGVQNGNDVNRVYTVEATPTTQEFCFNTCEAMCTPGNATDKAFASALSMMPNPAGDFVNISYQFDGLTNLNVRLINSIGQVMAVRNYDNALVGTERIDLSQLPSGAYTVVFSNGESTFGKRLIVE